MPFSTCYTSQGCGGGGGGGGGSSSRSNLLYTKSHLSIINSFKNKIGVL